MDSVKFYGEPPVMIYDATVIQGVIDRVLEHFKTALYAPDETFLKNMETNNLAGDDIRKYQFWEWPQGVGLYALWELYHSTNDTRCLELLTTYYDERIASGLPGKNINTMAPILALSYVAEHTKNEQYLEICREWAHWAAHDLARTKEGGFQHITSDTVNDQELWDDTLFMTVLALVNVGRIIGNEGYIQEGIYQFLIHAKYLADKRTGLWFHGFTFHGNHNFAEALWGRGNCWVTISIPILLEMVDLPPSTHTLLSGYLNEQVASLIALQNESGMWHTLLDDPTSYLESSATCGIAFGILKGVHLGVLPRSYSRFAMKAIEPIVGHITEGGQVLQVSYGTPMGRESKDFYKQIPLQPMPYGEAIALLFLMEVLVALEWRDV